VKAFFEPQLPLEAGLIRAGAVAGVAADAPLADLAYVKLGAGRSRVEWVSRGGDDPASLADEAVARLNALARLYQDPATGYLSRARPKFAQELDGDYDHLARVAEWQGG
jgi:ATP-dependent helicase/nuclease subunit B